MTQRSRRGQNYDARISQLERAVSELREEIRAIRRDFDPNAWAANILQPPKPKRGRKPTISRFVLMDRDELIEMLESYWPEIGPSCNDLDPERLRGVLELIAQPIHGRNAGPAKHLLRHFDKLIEFLRTERYRGDPRQIANAIAGVDKVSWWRSLKHCGAHPSDKVRDDRAIRDYLRRKHPEIYRRLEIAGGDVLRIAVGLKNVRSKDSTVSLLKSNAQYAAQIWRAGAPDASRLRKSGGVHRVDDSRSGLK
jgi:hypothetical protein